MGFFLFFQRKEQTASAAVFSTTLLLGKQAGTFRIGDGTLHRLSGKLQITGNGSDSRIALILLITPIFQVHIHIFGAMRQITVIDCRKISPDIPPLVGSKRRTVRHMMLSRLPFWSVLLASRRTVQKNRQPSKFLLVIKVVSLHRRISGSSSKRSTYTIGLAAYFGIS